VHEIQGIDEPFSESAELAGSKSKTIACCCHDRADFIISNENSRVLSGRWISNSKFPATARPGSGGSIPVLPFKRLWVRFIAGSRIGSSHMKKLINLEGLKGSFPVFDIQEGEILPIHMIRKESS
jgi:hypothetical protein